MVKIYDSGAIARKDHPAGLDFISASSRNMESRSDPSNGSNNISF
jgi:hypothetical protein